MLAVLWGPRRPLQASLTEEQFICQHPPALLRYLIPLFLPGAAGSRGDTHSHITLEILSRGWQSNALGGLRNKWLH